MSNPSCFFLHSIFLLVPRMFLPFLSSPTPTKTFGLEKASFLWNAPSPGLGGREGAAPNTLPCASKVGEVVINQPTLTLDLQAPWHRPRPCRKVVK